MQWVQYCYIPIDGDRYQIQYRGATSQRYEYEPQDTRRLHLPQVHVQIKRQVIRQSQPHRQIRYGQVQNELIRYETGEASAQRHGQDGQGVAAEDGYHQQAVDEGPQPQTVNSFDVLHRVVDPRRFRNIFERIDRFEVRPV